MSFKWETKDIISPKIKMPVPDTYFFLIASTSQSGQLIPAVLSKISSHITFYQNCKMFKNDGSTEYPTEGIRFIGWLPMFPKTQTYTITINEIDEEIPEKD